MAATPKTMSAPNHHRRRSMNLNGKRLPVGPILDEYMRELTTSAGDMKVPEVRDYVFWTQRLPAYIAEPKVSLLYHLTKEQKTFLMKARQKYEAREPRRRNRHEWQASQRRPKLPAPNSFGVSVSEIMRTALEAMKIRVGSSAPKGIKLPLTGTLYRAMYGEGHHEEMFARLLTERLFVKFDDPDPDRVHDVGFAYGPPLPGTEVAVSYSGYIQPLSRTPQFLPGPDTLPGPSPLRSMGVVSYIGLGGRTFVRSLRPLKELRAEALALLPEIHEPVLRECGQLGYWAGLYAVLVKRLRLFHWSATPLSPKE